MADLIITGMAAYEYCDLCDFTVWDSNAGEDRCFFTGNYTSANYDRRHGLCPIRPVPDGSRLIDANKVTDAKFLPEEASVSEYARGWNDALDAIKENAPSIIQPETKPAEAAAQLDERRAEDAGD